ncbi:MAG TPA: hypothetical protein VIU34_37300 [Steroidobacter sp.]
MHAIARPERQPALLATARTLLIMLVAADLAFILLHVIYVETSLLRGRPFSLEADNGIPEAYQYVKQFWVALCMVGLFRRTREVTYIGVGIVFTFLLLDDAFQMHEHFGKWLAAQYSLPVAFGLRPDDIGELLFAAFVGGVTLLLIGIGYWRGGPDARIVTRDISILILVLAGLGVGVDVIHVITYFKAPMLAQFLLIVEDGGEMIVVSATAAYVFNVLIHEGRAPVDLWAIIRDFASQRLRRRA